MRMSGTCDFCGVAGDWEAGLFKDQDHVKTRPQDWAAAFPGNVSQLPETCTFSNQDLATHGVEIATACPGCVRGKNANCDPRAGSRIQ